MGPPPHPPPLAHPAKSPPRSMDPAAYATDLAHRAKSASRLLATLHGDRKNRWLLATAQALEDRSATLLDANQRDIELAPQYELTPAQVARLRLTPARIAAAAEGLRQVAALPDPVGA